MSVGAILTHDSEPLKGMHRPFLPNEVTEECQGENADLKANEKPEQHHSENSPSLYFFV